MAEVPDKFAVLVVLNDAVAGSRTGEPHILVAVDEHRLQPARPARAVIRSSPTPNDAAVLVEFDYFRAEHAALLPRRRQARAEFVGPRVRLAIDYPEVILLIHGHV